MSAAPWYSPADLRGQGSSSIAPGDLVRTEGGFRPHYQIIALSEDSAWIVDLQSGTNLVIPGGRQAPLAAQMSDVRSRKCN